MNTNDNILNLRIDAMFDAHEEQSMPNINFAEENNKCTI